MADRIRRPDTCSNCGATYTPGLAWCGRCYAPIPSVPVPGPPSRPTDHLVKVEMTRWHATAETFGPTVKIVLSLLYLVVAGSVLSLYVRAVDLVGTVFIVNVIGSAALIVFVGVLYLRHLWRPGRR